jgi:hypothetical protein
MKRWNQMMMYRLGANVSPLRDLNAVPERARQRGMTLIAEIYLNHFITDPLNPDLMPRAKERAGQVLGQLQKSFQKEEVPVGEFTVLQSLLAEFEVSLEDDLARLPTYLVERVAAYSTDQMIGSAENVFPEKIRKLIPEQARKDFTSAGACLVFDLPTACGFHVYRAADAMLRKYCDHFDAKPKGSGRDWGRYIQALRDATAEPKPNLRTIELLDSIRALDRNPLVHPEQNLDSDGALMAFDLCKNAICLMVADMCAASRLSNDASAG